MHGSSPVKISPDLTNYSNEEHPAGAAAFGVRCLVSLKIQEMLIL